MCLKLYKIGEKLWYILILSPLVLLKTSILGMEEKTYSCNLKKINERSLHLKLEISV